MKVNILFDLHDGPMGGGNQFLKALRGYFRTKSVYEDNPDKADVILFNGHQFANRAAKLRLRYSDKPFVHRIDGPSKIYNKKSDTRDSIVGLVGKYLADATIFQSEWSKQENHRLGHCAKESETVINNAPDPMVFNKEGSVSFSRDRKTRLIATSWSDNWNKGFDVYKWLDENLDFERYEMIFLGNSPTKFKNIAYTPPLTTTKVAENLKKSDIFVFSSRFEACSNSLLEAMHCGLPAVGANESSNPELIGKGGETFNKAEDIPDLLQKIADNYHKYQNLINVSSIDEIGKKYYDFISQVYDRIKAGQQKIKPFGFKDYLALRSGIYYSKIIGRIVRIFERP